MSVHSLYLCQLEKHELLATKCTSNIFLLNKTMPFDSVLVFNHITIFVDIPNYIYLSITAEQHFTLTLCILHPHQIGLDHTLLPGMEDARTR